MERKDILPALLRPGMYAGAQGDRHWFEWVADAVAAYLTPSAAPSDEHWHTRFFEADVRRAEAVLEGARLKADMTELRRVCTARIEELETTSIPLTKAEIQSGHNRVQWAENLIRQLPTGHNGRDSWLLNYGTKAEDGQ
jgi:hypothetical protein